MSDYGAGLHISRKDQSSIKDEDIDLIQDFLDLLADEDEYIDAIGEEFVFDIHEDDEDDSTLFIMLSEYWQGEENSDKVFEFAKESDMPQAMEIASRLKEKLGDQFDIEPSFDHW